MSGRLSTVQSQTRKRPKVVLQKDVSLRALVLECLWPRIKPFRTKMTSNKAFEQQLSQRIFSLTVLHLELQAFSLLSSIKSKPLPLH